MAPHINPDPFSHIDDTNQYTLLVESELILLCYRALNLKLAKSRPHAKLYQCCYIHCIMLEKYRDGVICGYFCASTHQTYLSIFDELNPTENSIEADRIPLYVSCGNTGLSLT